MANTYKLETIARTASSGSGLTSFDTTPSINDFGLVSFVGNLNGEEDLFTGNASSPITNLSISFPFTNFSSGIEINNDNQIVAVDSGGGGKAIRLWDADNPGSYRKTIATAIFGNEFTQFDNIFPFASINNVTPPQSEESEVVFNADPKGDNATSVGLHTYKSFSGENT